MSLPATMTAIAITKPGDADVLKPVQMPVPEPKAREVLIKVEAAGVNRPDILQRQGNYPAPPGASEIPGLEVAGEVVALGEEVARYALGDKVTALLTGGGYAEYCVADERAALPYPTGLDAVQAASLPETFFTVWQNVFDRGALQAGEYLLVHGGTSGIGVTAIQMAKAAGATVFATAGSAEKCAFCVKLGADRAINYREEDFVTVIRNETAGKGVNLILDMVGGDYIARNIAAAADDGRIHQIAFQSGSKVTVDLMRVMLKRLTLSGSTLRIRPAAVKERIAQALETRFWPLLAAGEIKAVIDSTYPLASAAEAHKHMEANVHIGKIILKV